MNHFTLLMDALQWIHILGLLLLCNTQVIAETTYAPCYYPNGAFEPNDMPCSDAGGGCCPPRWICLRNGVCYLPTDGSFERHTCTDNAWGSECPSWCITSWFLSIRPCTYDLLTSARKHFRSNCKHEALQQQYRDLLWLRLLRRCRYRQNASRRFAFCHHSRRASDFMGICTGNHGISLRAGVHIIDNRLL